MSAAAGWRSDRHRARLAVVDDPTWLIAPLFVRDAHGLRQGEGSLPGPLTPAVGHVIDGSTILDTPVTAALTGAWDRWWARALAHEPWRTPPSTTAHTADPPLLRAVWGSLAAPWAKWRATAEAVRNPDVDEGSVDMSVEAEAATRFVTARDRRPAARTIFVLVLPVGGHYLHCPAPRRILVSVALRRDPVAYRQALDEELARHW